MVGELTEHVMIRDFRRRHGQYFSIHAFDSVLSGDIKIEFHDERKSVDPDYLCWIYIDIEPKKEGVTSRNTFATAVELLKRAEDRLGAVPVVLRTRPGRYGMLFPFKRKVEGEYVKAYKHIVMRFLDYLGMSDQVNVTIDTVFDLARVTRVPYTYHELTGRLITPVEYRDGRFVAIKPREFFEYWEPFDWSVVEEAIKQYEEERERAEEEYRRQIYQATVKAQRMRCKPPELVKRSVVHVKREENGWRCINTPDFGRVCYAAFLEGWGWLKYIVRNRVALPDGRLTMCWYHLPFAVKQGWVSDLDAREFIEVNIRQYPDRSFEEYWDKFQRNKKYGYTAPTWRSLLLGVRKDGVGLDESNLHIRPPVLWALMKLGLVKVEKRDHLEEIMKEYVVARE